MKFNIDSGLRKSINQEIDLFDEIQSHTLWTVRLKKYIDGKMTEKLDPHEICRDDQCDLGQWIYGSGLKKFYIDENFHKLRADHSRFHVSASKVIRHVHDNELSAAETMLDGEFKKISHDMLTFLAAMKEI